MCATEHDHGEVTCTLTVFNVASDYVRLQNHECGTCTSESITDTEMIIICVGDRSV